MSYAGLRAVERGCADKERCAADAAFDPDVFTTADHPALAGGWSCLGDVVEPALAAAPGGLIDDDLAYVYSRGFVLTTGPTPVLTIHGAQNRMVPATHGYWLATTLGAEHWLRLAAGQLSILHHAPAALTWLVNHTHP